METNDIISITDILHRFKRGLFQDWISTSIPKFWSVLGCVILAIIVFLIGKHIIKLIQRVMKKSLNHHLVDESLATFLMSLVKWICYIFLTVLILGLFGITTSTIAASVAAMGITAGLSLQGTLSNFAGGCLILLVHPFKMGDYIKEDAHGNEGIVSNVSILYTTLTSIDGKQIIVPNGTLANTSLTNYSSKGKRMINESVGISYDSDIKKAKNILYEIAKSETRTLESEDIRIFVSSLDDSCVSLGVRFWVNVEDYWNVKWDTLEKIKEEFDTADISICFNQLDVHVDSYSKN